MLNDRGQYSKHVKSKGSILINGKLKLAIEQQCEFNL